MDRAQAEEQLQGRNKDSRKLANHTYLKRRGDDIVVQLYSTDVLTFRKDGKIVVNSGGWKTVTTKDQINSYLPRPLGIFQERGVWYWGDWSMPKAERTPFTDGDTAYYRDRAWRISFLAKKGDVNKAKDLMKRIDKYVKDFAAALPVERPGAGDCLFCQLQTAEGQSMGDAVKDTDHLLSHMEESYFVPSLLYRAMKEQHCGDMVVYAAFKDPEHPDNSCMLDLAKEYGKRALKAYLKLRLGIAR